MPKAAGNDFSGCANTGKSQRCTMAGSVPSRAWAIGLRSQGEQASDQLDLGAYEPAWWICLGDDAFFETQTSEIAKDQKITIDYLQTIWSLLVV